MEILGSLCERYACVVTAGDSNGYAKLFTPDAIRMPPGAEIERGVDEIRRGEQAAYDEADWHVASTPVEALQLGDRWIYGIASVEAVTTARTDGARSRLHATKTWLLERAPSGGWLIARQMWNLREIEELDS